MSNLRKKLIGDKAFYIMVLTVAIPIMVQNGFTNFVNLLDNIMVGRIGTEEMSGVSIANQLVFVFNLCIFGATSGAGIFGAQYFGQKDDEGVRRTCRYKMWIGCFLSILAAFIFLTFGNRLISLFLSGSEDGGSIQETLYHSKKYLNIMILGLFPFAIIQAFASTLREGGETILPMKAGIAALSSNLVLNYILIYGHFGAPALGVSGAAIATVISRYLEMTIVIIGAYRAKHMTFTDSLFKPLSIPLPLVSKYTKASIPLLMNESLWSLGMTFLLQCYSTRGLNAVAGYNIFSTLYNVFSVTFMAVGTSVGIIVGQLLGAGKAEEAKDTDRKMITFAVMLAFVTGLVMMTLSTIFPSFYNTNEEARTIAKYLIIAQGCVLPVVAFKNSTYFTLRSGGQIWVTILFDSAYIWFVGVPIAFLVSRFTNASVTQIFLSVQAGDILKCIIGVHLVKKGVWIRNIVEEDN